MPLRNLIFRIQADDEASRVLAGVAGNVRKVGQAAAPLFTGVAGVAGIAGITVGLARALGDVVRQGRDFSFAMSAVSAVTQSTSADMAELTKQARQLGATTQFTAVQAANAMSELGKAGFETTEIMKVMPDVLNLAGAGMLEMQTAASITADLVRSLGIALEDFSYATDVVAKTATSSKTTVEELGYAFQDSAPVARQLGLGVVELNSLLGVLANRGFVATRAGTALRRIFAVLLGDIEKGEKGLANFNLRLFEAGKFVGFPKLLAEMRAKGVQAFEILEAFGLRGGPAFLQIFDEGATKIEAMRRALDDVGAAGRISRERFNNLTGDALQLTSALSEIRLVLFDQVVPALRAATQQATEFARAVGRYMANTDVWMGLKRIIVVTTVLLGGLIKLIAVKAVAAIRALAAAAVNASIGFNAQWMAIVRNNSALRVLSSEMPLKMKAGFGLMSAAAVAFGWQIGRLIGELTGLDGVVRSLFMRAIDATTGQVAASFEAVAGQARLLQRRLEAFEAEGITIKLTEDLEATRKRMADFAEQMKQEIDEIVEHGLRREIAAPEPPRMLGRPRVRTEFIIEPGDVDAAVAHVQAKFREIEAKFIVDASEFATLEQKVLFLQQEFAKLGPDEQEIADRIEALRRHKAEIGLTFTIEDEQKIRAEAQREADQLRDLFSESLAEVGEISLSNIGRVFDVFQTKRAKAVEELARQHTRDKEALVALEEAVKELEKALAKAGAASDTMGARLVAKLQMANKAAEAIGVDAVWSIRAYQDEILKTVEGLRRLGKEVPDILLEAERRIRIDLWWNLPDDADDTMSALAARFQDVGLTLDESINRKLLWTQQLMEDISEMPLTPEIAIAEEQLRSHAQTLIESIVPGWQQVTGGVIETYRALAILNEQGLEALLKYLQQAKGVWQNINKEVIPFEEVIRRIAKDGVGAFNEAIQSGQVEVVTLGETIRVSLGEVAIQAANRLGSALADAFITGKFKFREFIKEVIRGIVQAITQALILRGILTLFGGGGQAAPAPVEVYGQGGVVQKAQHGILIRGGIPGRDTVPILAQAGESVLPKSLTDFLMETALEHRRGGAERRRDRPTVIQKPIEQPPLVVHMHMLDGADTVQRILEDNPEAVAAGLRNAIDRGAF